MVWHPERRSPYIFMYQRTDGWEFKWMEGVNFVNRFFYRDAERGVADDTIFILRKMLGKT